MRRAIDLLRACACAVLTLPACGGIVVFDDDQTSGADDDTAGASTAGSSTAGGGAGPVGCDLEAGPLTLDPAADNPDGCQGALTCEVWFGHGQHLSCPELLSTSPGYAACDIWDCICESFPDEGFVADFSTGEVVDMRDPDRTCRYTLEWGS